MKTIKTDWCIVTCPDDEATKQAVFDKILSFYKEHEVFSGESIMQSDIGMDAPELLSDIADDILKFKVEYTD